MSAARMLMFAAGLAAFLGAGPVRAQMANCAGAQTQMALNACAGKDYKKADAALNQVYGKLKGKLTKPADRKPLAAAERAWIAYRDAECAFETAGTADGTIHPMLMAMCLNEKTLVHTAELSRQLNCKEGDPSCVH
jgi:uncharacterized protein YecT (DUF1311 family)